MNVIGTITTNALVKRINRRLSAREELVVRLRGKAAGEHVDYVLIPKPNLADVMGWGRHGPPSRFAPVWNLETFGRELGVLAATERVG